MSGTTREAQGKTWETELMPRLIELERITGETAAKALSAAQGPADLREAIQKVNDRMTELEQVGAVAAAQKTGAAHANTAEGTLGDYLRGRNVAGKALSLDSDSTGAILAPPEFVAKITELLTDLVPMRSYAQVITTASASVTVPRAGTNDVATWDADDSTPHANVTGPTMALDEIPAEGMHYDVFIGNKLRSDSRVNLEAWVASRSAYRFAQLEGESFITGSGTGQPEGILINAAIVAAATAQTGASGALKPEDIIGLFHKLPQVYANRGTWVLDRTHLALIRSFREGGTTGAFVWQRNIGLQVGNPPTILDRPYIVSESAPTTAATTGQVTIGFGDIDSTYLVVDHADASVLVNPFATGGAGVIVHTRKRVGGGVIQSGAFKALKVGS